MSYIYYVSNQEGDIAHTRSRASAIRSARAAHRRGLNLITIECYDGEYHGSGGNIRYILDFDGKRFHSRKDLTWGTL